MSLKFAIALACALALNACSGSKEDDLDGAQSGSPEERNFAVLINKYSKAKVNPTPWAGYWWPFEKSGIAAQGIAAKYDAALGRGRTDGGSAEAWENSHHGPKRADGKKVESWEGHCNGWSVAAALFNEPRENVTVNGITFTPTEVRALLTEAGLSAYVDMYGNRVEGWGGEDPRKTEDIVPNQMLLLLTNYIGRKGYPVLIDRDTHREVWNQPLAGYEIEYPKPDDYKGGGPNIYKINLGIKIWWVDDSLMDDSFLVTQFNFEDAPYIDSRELRMEIWLDGPVVFDAEGRITSSGNVVLSREGDFAVGGAWLMGEGMPGEIWPDFMWIPHSVYKPEIPNGPGHDGRDPESNPYIDINWIREHLLVPGGRDDPSVTPRPVPPPRPEPASSSTPTPDPFPTPRPPVVEPEEPSPRPEPSELPRTRT